MTRETFAAALADLRSDRRLSQNQLAFEAGVDSSYLCRLEKDLRKPSPDTVLRLASVLHALPGDTARLMTAAGFMPPTGLDDLPLVDLETAYLRAVARTYGLRERDVTVMVNATIRSLVVLKESDERRPLGGEVPYAAAV